MALREGAHASYIGSEIDGREVGDRCLILSVESRYSDVRWVTGSLVGSYQKIGNEDLVADMPPKRFEDEFTFESNSNRIVNTACREMLDKRGTKALISALRQEGHYETVLSYATLAVHSIMTSLDSDPAWSEVDDDLGDEAFQFRVDAVSHAVKDAIVAYARNGKDDADVF